MANRVFEELLRGRAAHADPIACIEDVSAELAGKRIDGCPHSIWQLVNHMNYWMDYEIKRVAGEAPAYPEHAAQGWSEKSAPASENQWSAERDRFNALLQKILDLARSPQDVLAREVKATHPSHAKVASSVQSVLWQILVHNSYHTGQIALIRRCLGIWPPRAGGDSW